MFGLSLYRPVPADSDGPGLSLRRLHMRYVPKSPDHEPTQFVLFRYTSTRILYHFSPIRKYFIRGKQIKSQCRYLGPPKGFGEQGNGEI